MAKPVTRRGFLKTSIAGAAALGLSAMAASDDAKTKQGDRSMTIRPAGVTSKGDISHRMFFFTENGPERAYGVHHVYAPVEKSECRVGDGGLGFSCIDFGDPLLMEDGIYRCYGTARTPDQRFMGIGLWESKDALHWTPVMLGQVKRDGRSTNLIHFENLPGDQTMVGLPNVIPVRDGLRMYFWKYRDGQVRYLIAESRDGLKWRVLDVDKPVLYHPSDGGLFKLAEGLTPERVPEIKLPPNEVLRHKRLWSNDSTHIHYNEQLGRYECYSVWLHPAIPDRRVDVDNAPGVHRLIHRRLSNDGIRWSDAELIIMPDDRDPWDLQFYFLSVHHQEDWMIGRLGYYRVADGMQSMDTDLCFSRDGRTWERPVRGGWIPRSADGFDKKGIYAGAAWIDKGDKWLTLYSGTPVTHNAEQYKSMPMAASFTKNRLVGLAAGSTPGGFLTEPFFPAGQTVRVDADIKGSLRAELCDAFGRKLDGFRMMDSTPVTGDSGAHVLRWENASAAGHRYECVRLRFEYTDGVIYGVDFS